MNLYTIQYSTKPIPPDNANELHVFWLRVYMKFVSSFFFFVTLDDVISCYCDIIRYDDECLTIINI